MDDRVVRTCKTCNTTKQIDEFEKTAAKSRRLDCKKCYSCKKAERAKTAAKSHVPSSVPKPTACAECSRGQPDVDFKWRTDINKGGWRNTCNDCFNKKGYSQASRKRRMEKDPDGYRAHSARVHLDWSRRNPDKLKEQQLKERMDPDRRIKSLVTEANARNINVDMRDSESLKLKFTQSCAYCAFTPEIGKDFLNGLSRVDHTGGYTDTNTVPCCGVCNHMKGPQEIDEFIDNIRRITKHLNLDIEAVVVGSRTPARALGGWVDLRVSSKKEKKDLLTVEQKVELWSSPCYVCGRSPSFGIDRYDASGDYTTENSKPCCTDCNYMKSDRPFQDFTMHVGLIAAFTATWVLKDVRNVPLKICSGAQRIPVVMCDPTTSNAHLIFPSMSCAADVMGVTLPAIEKGMYCLQCFVARMLAKRISRAAPRQTYMCGYHHRLSQMEIRVNYIEKAVLPCFMGHFF